MTKADEYAQLVAQRKACHLCTCLTNPSTVDNGSYDSDHIGPWTRWQGNLDASLMVVGQDWGDVGYFIREKGREKPTNPTNVNLRKLLESIGISVSQPRDNENNQIVYFTNAILCLKEKGMQSSACPKWFENCRGFLKAQIDLVKPQVVVGLGEYAFDSIYAAYFGQKAPKLKEAIENKEGYLMPNDICLFFVYHCGPRIINMTRSFDLQLEDWKRIEYSLQYLKRIL